MPTNDFTHDLGVSEADLELDAAIDALCMAPVPALPKSKPTVLPPKVVVGMSFADYHSDLASVGAGSLRDVARSPLHHYYAHRRPGREPEQPSAAQLLGTAIHCAVLEPGEFMRRFVTAPDVDRRTTAGKAAYAAFLLSAAGKTPLSVDQTEAAMNVAGAVRGSEMAGRLLRAGRVELSCYWTDRATGVRCRMRPDFAPDVEPVIVDLKSCEDAGERAFAASAWRHGYHVTAAWYVDGWRAVMNEKRDYIFAAWEKEPPYASAWYYATDEMLEAGRAEYRRLLAIYAECLARDKWPGYAAELQPLYPPAWAMDHS